MIYQLKTPIYKLLEKNYIEIYYQVREEGYKDEQAFIATKIKFQEHIINFMMDNKKEINLIILAYKCIKEDKKIREKAIINFDLKSCSPTTRNKYMPLLMQ